ncbi:MAG: MFS transporter [Betaproteobacteria bacterium]|nr:MFS transporter [Betaproteobacteria bacterium]MSQ88640.1 MFS transporter [Betaproteobacteria bacterium]
MTKVAPALPLQRAELGLTLVESGFIATTFNVMGGLVGMLAGTMCDRYGHRRLGLTGLAILTLAGLLGSMAWSFPVLLASRFFEGIGFILFTVVATALITTAADDPRDRAKALGLWSAYMPTGGGLALLLAPPVIAAWGWRGLWVLLALGAAACLVLAARYAPRPKFGGITSLRLIAESLAQRGNIVFALLFMFYVSQWSSVMIWLPTFLVDERGASATSAALLTALMVLVNAPGNIAGGWLLAHGVRRGPLIVTASAVMATCSLGMFGGFLPDTARYLLCLVFSACAGVIPGAIFSGLPVHAKTPQHISTANGLVMQASQAGQFFGPIALAWLASRYGGWDATLWAMLAFATGGALCGFALERIERRLRR